MRLRSPPVLPMVRLACRAATYLASSCIRLGLRIEAMRWVEAAVGADLLGDTRFSASIGLVCGWRPVDPGDLLRAADQRLYEAKRAGRDRVVGLDMP